jgi:hypothetical protein
MASYISDTFWYNESKNQVHTAVFEHVTAVDSDQRSYHEDNLCYARLYSNRDEPGLGPATGHYRPGWTGVTENVIESVVDTATSLIGKSRPKVTVFTAGGTWNLQQIAKDLDKYLFGMFTALKVHEKMTQAFRDSCIFGTGVLKIIENEDNLTVERVLVDNIIVDEQEVPECGQPRQLHQVHLVSKELLKKKFPSKASFIENAGKGDAFREFTSWRRVESQMVLVIESWHLNPDGRHTLVVDNATLVDEKYEEDWFPFVFLHWSEPVTGFYGRGLAQQLLGHQIRLNELNDFIQRCQDLIAIPRVAIDAGSRLLKVELNNEIGAIIPYVGKPPIFFTPQALNTEIYSYKEQIKTSAFEFAGISKMAAQATRPEGIEAAVALRELSDNQSQRFSRQQQNLEERYKDVGKVLLVLAQKIYSDSGSAPKTFMDEDFVNSIEWDEVDFEQNKFVLRVDASSMLSETPAARKQTLIEFAQYGVPLTPEIILKYINHPDLEDLNKRLTAKQTYADWVASQLLKGEFVVPDPISDLNLNLQIVTAAYLDVATKPNVPEEILSNMVQYIDLAKLEIERATQALQQQQTLGATLPEGSVTEAGLPGIGPPGADTAETALSGILAG